MEIASFILSIIALIGTIILTLYNIYIENKRFKQDKKYFIFLRFKEDLNNLNQEFTNNSIYGLSISDYKQLFDLYNKVSELDTKIFNLSSEIYSIIDYKTYNMIETFNKKNEYIRLIDTAKELYRTNKIKESDDNYAFSNTWALLLMLYHLLAIQLIDIGSDLDRNIENNIKKFK